MGNTSSHGKGENWGWCRNWQKTWGGSHSVVTFNEGKKLCTLFSHYEFVVALGLSVHSSLTLMWYPRHELPERDFPNNPPKSFSANDPYQLGWFGSLNQFTARIPLDAWYTAVFAKGKTDPRLRVIKIFLVSLLIQRQEDAFLAVLRIAEKVVVDVLETRPSAAALEVPAGYLMPFHELIISHCSERMIAKVFYLVKFSNTMVVSTLFKTAVSAGNVSALKFLLGDYSEERPSDSELVTEALSSDSNKALEFMVRELGIVPDSFYETSFSQSRVNRSCPRCFQFLANSDATLLLQQHTGKSLLHVACEAHSMALVRICVDAGVNINGKGKLGRTAMLYLMTDLSFFLDYDGREQEIYEIFEFLISKGVDVDTADWSGRTLLHETKNIRFVKLLISAGADVHALDGQFRTPLFGASKEKTKLLLKAGCCRLHRNIYGTTAHFSAVHDEAFDTLLMESPSMITTRSPYTGETLLHKLASSSLDFNVLIQRMKRCLAAGIDVNGKNHQGKTPLIVACETCSYAVARYLLSVAHIDVSHRSHGGKTALLALCSSTSYSSWNSSEVVLLIQSLYKAGAKLEETADNGNTILHCADNLISVVQAIRTIQEKEKHESNQADHFLSLLVKSRGESGTTPLHILMRKFHNRSTFQACQVLLDLGADPSARDDQGKTPLQCLDLRYHLNEAREIIDLLVANGASKSELLAEPMMIRYAMGAQLVDAQDVTDRILSSRDKWGNSALHLAFEDNDAAAARALLSTGASLLSQNREGETPAHAFSTGDMIDIVTEHPSAHLLLQVKNNVGRTPFLSYVTHGRAVVSDIKKFVKAGSQVKGAVDEYGKNAIHLACMGAQSMEVIELLISLGAEISGRDVYGRPPLFECANREGEVKLMNSLIALGADPFAVDDFGNTLLHVVRTTSGAQLCLNMKLNINQVNFNNEDPLIAAAARCDWNLVEFLVRKGADVRRVSRYEKMSALHYLACRSEGVDVIEKMLDAGASADVLSASKRTPLHYAVREDLRVDLRVVRTLVRAAPKAVSTPSLEGFTPIMQIFRNPLQIRNFQLLQLFAEPEFAPTVDYNQTCRGRGSSVLTSSPTWRGSHLVKLFGEGLQMVHLAFRYAGPEIIDFLVKTTPRLSTSGLGPCDCTILHLTATGGYPDNLRHILALNEKWKINKARSPNPPPRSFDANAVDSHGRNALHYLGISGQLGAEAVKVLIAGGVSVTQADSRGITPLHALARRANPTGCGHVLPLLDAGVDVTAKCKRSSTPFHHSARSGNLQVMQLLHSRGADVNALDDRGRTAFHWLGAHDKVLQYSATLVQWLISVGADPTLKDGNNNTPLHSWLAAGFAIPTRTLQIFIDAGVSINAPGLGGRTPLMQAIRSGSGTPTIDLLLQKGADPSIVDEFGANVLFFMHNLNPNHWTLWERFIDLGASLQAKEEKKRHGYALIHHLAVMKAKKRKYLEHDSLTQATLQRIINIGKLDINQRTKYGRKTPLHLAAEHRRFSMIPRLLALGADKDLKDDAGRSALDILLFRTDDWGALLDPSAPYHFDELERIKDFDELERIKDYCICVWLLQGHRQVFYPIRPKEDERVPSDEEIDARNPFFKKLFPSIHSSLDRVEAEREKYRCLVEAQSNKWKKGEKGTEEDDERNKDLLTTRERDFVAVGGMEDQDLNEEYELTDGEDTSRDSDADDDDLVVVSGMTLKKRLEDARTDPRISTRLDGLLDRVDFRW